MEHVITHTMNHVYSFFAGFASMGAFVGAAFFFRYWRRTGEKLFVYFGLAFLTLGAERCLLGTYINSQEDQPLVYLIRLAAFLLILYGIFSKNIGQRRGKV